MSTSSQRQSRRRAGLIYLLWIADCMAVLFLIFLAAAVYDGENIEQPNVGFPILAAGGAVALAGAAVGTRRGWPRALLAGLWLMPLAAVIVALFLPGDSA